MIGRLRSEVEREVFELAMAERSLASLINSESRKATVPIELEGAPWNEEVIAEDISP